MPQPNVEAAAIILRAGMKQAEVAAYLSKALGRSVTFNQVSQIVNGKRKVAADEMDAFRILDRDGPGFAEEPAAFITEPEPLPDTQVALYGPAGIADATLRLTEAQRSGTVRVHPGQVGARAGFAFIQPDDRVASRLKRGDIGYAVRKRPPFPGQLCVVEMVSGEAVVAFYLRQDGSTVFLTFDGAKAPTAVPVRDIAELNPVVGSTFSPG